MPSSVKFREAYARGVPLVHYDRFSAGAEAYRAAARAFLGRGGTADRSIEAAADAPAMRSDRRDWSERLIAATGADSQEGGER